MAWEFIVRFCVKLFFLNMYRILIFKISVQSAEFLNDAALNKKKVFAIYLKQNEQKQMQLRFYGCIFGMCIYGLI